MKKNQRGITLIALVVTIIVLLVLAGVSIAMVTGSNGILIRASEASVNTKITDAEDIISLSVSEKITDYYATKYANGTGEETTLLAAVQEGITNAKTNIDSNVTVIDGITGQDETLSGTITVSYDGYSATGTIKGTALIWSTPEPISVPK